MLRLSRDLQIALVSGLLAGGFATLSAVVTVLTTSRREESRTRTQAALELPDLTRLIWGENYTDLGIALTRQEASLAVADVPEELIQALARTSRACWHDSRESRERSGGEVGGITVELLEANELVHRAIRAQLIRKPGRSQRKTLRVEALRSVETVLTDWIDPHWY